MNCLTNTARFENFTALGRSGTREDVDKLMAALAARDDLATSKLVDFALSLVDTGEGRDQMQHYLFNGSQVQRNFAALYFKRRGNEGLLEKALAEGKIDWQQAFAK